jgi:hypothetical protein
VRRTVQSSKTKVAHVVPIRHRDEVEAPITDWLAEAFRHLDAPAAKKPKAATAKTRKTKAAKASR